MLIISTRRASGLAECPYSCGEPGTDVLRAPGVLPVVACRMHRDAAEDTMREDAKAAARYTADTFLD